MASCDALRRSLKFKLKLILSENKILIKAIEEHVKRAETIYRDTEALEKIPTKVFMQAMARLERAYSACIKLILLASELFESDKKSLTDNLAVSQSASQDLEDSTSTSYDCLRTVDNETLRRLSSLERKFHKYVTTRGHDDFKAAVPDTDSFKNLSFGGGDLYHRMVSMVERPEVFCAADPVTELRRFLFGLDNQSNDGYRDPRIILSNEKKKFPNEVVPDVTKGVSHTSPMVATADAALHSVGTECGDGKNVPVDIFAVDELGTAGEKDKNCNDVASEYPKSVRVCRKKDSGDSLIPQLDNAISPVACQDLGSERNNRHHSPVSSPKQLKHRVDTQQGLQRALVDSPKFLRQRSEKDVSPQNGLNLKKERPASTLLVSAAISTGTKSMVGPSEEQEKTVLQQCLISTSPEKVQNVQRENDDKPCISSSASGERTFCKSRVCPHSTEKKGNISPPKEYLCCSRPTFTEQENTSDVTREKRSGTFRFKDQERNCLFHNSVPPMFPRKAEGFLEMAIANISEHQKDKNQTFAQCKKTESPAISQQSNICDDPISSPIKLLECMFQCATEKETTSLKEDNVQSILQRIGKMEHLLEHEISKERRLLIQCLREFQRLLDNSGTNKQTESFLHNTSKSCENNKYIQTSTLSINGLEKQAQSSKGAVCNEEKVQKGQGRSNYEITCRHLANSYWDEKENTQINEKNDEIRHRGHNIVRKPTKQPKHTANLAVHKVIESRPKDDYDVGNMSSVRRDFSELDCERCAFCSRCRQCTTSYKDSTATTATCSMTGGWEEVGSSCLTDSAASSEHVEKRTSFSKPENGILKVNTLEQDGSHERRKHSYTRHGYQSHPLSPDNLCSGGCERNSKGAASAEKNLRNRFDEVQRAMLHLLVARITSHFNTLSAMGEFKNENNCDRSKKFNLVIDNENNEIDEEATYPSKKESKTFACERNIQNGQEQEKVENQESSTKFLKMYKLIDFDAPLPDETGSRSKRGLVKDINSDVHAGLCAMPPDSMVNTCAASEPTDLLLCSSHPTTSQPLTPAAYLLLQPITDIPITQPFQHEHQFPYSCPSSEVSRQQRHLRRDKCHPRQTIAKTNEVVGSAEHSTQKELSVDDKILPPCLEISNKAFHQPTNAIRPSASLNLQKVTQIGAISQNDCDQLTHFSCDKVKPMRNEVPDKTTTSEVPQLLHQITHSGAVASADDQCDTYPQFLQMHPQTQESANYIEEYGMPRQQQKQQQQIQRGVEQQQHVGQQVSSTQSQFHSLQHHREEQQQPHTFLQQSTKQYPDHDQHQLPLQYHRPFQTHPNQSVGNTQKPEIEADTHKPELHHRAHSSPDLRLPNSCPAMIFVSSGGSSTEHQTLKTPMPPQLPTSLVANKSGEVSHGPRTSLPSPRPRQRQASKSMSKACLASRASGDNACENHSTSLEKAECRQSNHIVRASHEVPVAQVRKAVISRRVLSQGPCRRSKAENRTVCITNLPSQLAEVQLLKVLNEHGYVSKIYFIKHRSTGQFQGTAYVKFRQSSEAQSAVSALNQHVLEGQRVNASIMSKNHPQINFKL